MAAEYGVEVVTLANLADAGSDINTMLSDTNLVGREDVNSIHMAIADNHIHDGAGGTGSNTGRVIYISRSIMAPWIRQGPHESINFDAVTEGAVNIDATKDYGVIVADFNFVTGVKA